MDSHLPARTTPTNAFERVYAAEYVTLTRLATAVVGDVGVAEEATQEAFAVAWQRWETLESPIAFLRRTVLNGAIDRSRRRARTQRRDADLQRLSATSQHHDDVRLWTLLDGLPDPQRAALALRFVEGLTNAEIGTVVGRPENTVKSDIRRGIQTLREEMSDAAL